MSADLSAPGGDTTLAATLSPVVRVVDRVDDIAADDWRRVSTGCGLYSSPRWLRSLEDDPGHDVWYITARAADGALIGVLPVYLATSPSLTGSDSFYDPGGVFFASAAERDLVLPEAATRWRPSLLAGGRSGYDTELLLSPTLGPSERGVVLRSMLDRFAKLGDAWGVDARAVMYLVPDAARELGPVLQAEPLLTDLTAAIALDGMSTFDDYLRALSRRRRTVVRHETRCMNEAGFTLRWTRLDDTVEIVARLLASHQQRYGHADTAAMLTQHLRQQAAELDDLSHVLLCERSGEVLGALLVYEWDGCWYVRFAATGAGLRGEAFAFFTLLFYAPIAAAIERGIGTFVLGPSSLDAKIRRGATLQPRLSLLSGRGALGADVDAIERTWNAAQLQRWKLEHGYLAS